MMWMPPRVPFAQMLGAVASEMDEGWGNGGGLRRVRLRGALLWQRPPLLHSPTRELPRGMLGGH